MALGGPSGRPSARSLGGWGGVRDVAVFVVYVKVSYFVFVLAYVARLGVVIVAGRVACGAVVALAVLIPFFCVNLVVCCLCAVLRWWLCCLFGV